MRVLIFFSINISLTSLIYIFFRENAISLCKKYLDKVCIFVYIK